MFGALGFRPQSGERRHTTNILHCVNTHTLGHGRIHTDPAGRRWARGARYSWPSRDSAQWSTLGGYITSPPPPSRSPRRNHELLRYIGLPVGVDLEHFRRATGTGTAPRHDGLVGETHGASLVGCFRRRSPWRGSGGRSSGARLVRLRQCRGCGVTVVFGDWCQRPVWAQESAIPPEDASTWHLY